MSTSRIPTIADRQAFLWDSRTALVAVMEARSLVTDHVDVSNDLASETEALMLVFAQDPQARKKG